MDKKRHIGDWLLVCAAIAPYLYLVYSWNFLCDDAFISFRYAQNLVHGYGLRYNPVEQPPVEGYSNFLWVLLLAALAKIGASPLLASRAISVLAGVLLLAAVYWTCRRTLTLDRLQAFMGAFACAVMPPLAVWSTGGLETIPFTLVLFVLIVRVTKSESGFPLLSASILGTAVMLLRPEGMGYPILAGALAAILRPRTSPVGPWLRGVAIYLFIMIIALAAVTLWRFFYFDSLLPNTFYAKVGFTGSQIVRGGYYIIQFFLAFAGALLVMMWSGFSLLQRKRPRTHVMLFSAAVTLFVVPLLLGGDFMAMGRLLVPAVPFLSLLLAARICPRWRDLKRMPAPVFLIVTILVIGCNYLPALDWYIAPRAWREQFHFRWNMPDYLTEKEIWRQMKEYTEVRTALGRALADISEPDQSVVTTAIGAIGYYSRLHVYDKLGLVTREVARAEAERIRRSAGHDKAVSFAYFLRYKPDFVNPRLVTDRELEAARQRMRTNLRIEFGEYRKDYRIASMPVPYTYKGSSMTLLTFRLKG